MLDLFFIVPVVSWAAFVLTGLIRNPREVEES